MDLSEKIGQLIMFGFKGTVLAAETRDLLKEYPFGGAILFSRNYSTKDELKELCSALQDCNATHRPDSPPLFISIDQEGGRVKRLGPPFTESPPNKTWGDMDDPEKTRENARVVGKELKETGININFAPVLDVDTNPDNPVIGDRAYGPHPELVARHGMAAIQGFRQSGVFPVGKHFPGHGHTSVDSHLDLPEIDTSLDQLKKVELVPFVQGIGNGLEMLMTAHVLYKNIDPDFPATFSRKILTGILREELGFQGLIFTDDMEMGAVAGHFDFSEACLLAFEAGSDVQLVCHDQEKQILAFRTLYDAVKTGRVSEDRVDASVRNIHRLKKRLTKDV